MAWEISIKDDIQFFHALAQRFKQEAWYKDQKLVGIIYVAETPLENFCPST